MRCRRGGGKAPTHARLAEVHGATHIEGMAARPPTLDMTPDGEFRPAPRPNGIVLGWKSRVLIAALGVSFVLGIVASAALLLPLVLLAVGYFYVSLRMQPRRNPGRDILRP